ncbi:hypothetical protein LXL04_024578 [Taraxacum kok-saghyz]
MASSSNTRDCSSDSDDGISDDDSLDVTLEQELAGGMNLTQDDEFLNLSCDDDKLASWYSSVTDAEMSYPEDDEQRIGVEFIVHNPMTKWSLLHPTEKEIYANPQQLKFALTNYAVANGCDNKRIQVKYGKAEGGKTCPWVLWVSWMGSDRSFQIKKISGTHICSRSYDCGGLVNPDWIAKYYVKEFLSKPDMKTRELKDDIEKKFFCKVNMGECHRAKVRIQTLIEGLLSEDLGLNEGRELSIISDQHKGLIEAVQEVIPHVEHTQCARHIYANLKKIYSSDEIRKLFWLAAKSTVEIQFMNHMNAIKAISVGAYDHLMARNPKSWCRAFFALGKACEAIENGMSESFNSVIDKARKKPIISMLEEIRLYMMNRCHKMSKIHETWEGDIYPSILQKLAKFKMSLRYWNVFPSGGNCFEVRSGFEAYKVDMEGKNCTCRSWGLCGYPRLHACATFYSFHTGPEKNVSFYFEKSKFVEAYKDNIQPLNGSNMWERSSYTKP